MVDAAHVLPEPAREALDRKVVAWDRASGRQLVVVTVPDLQGLDVKTYGYRLGRAWGLGDKARNDGVILLLAMRERKVRIEVGPGLEGELTDALTSAILRDRVVPRLKAGDVPGALDAGTDAITGAVSSAAASRQKLAGGELWAVVVALLAVLLGAGGAIWVWVRWMIIEPRRERKATLPRVMEKIRLERITRIPGGAAKAGRNPVVTPVIVPDPAPSASLPSGSGWGWGGSSSSSSSSSGSGSSSSSSSSSGFDSGGGSFSGGGSDSSW